jgi:hypothetical protein
VNKQAAETRKVERAEAPSSRAAAIAEATAPTTSRTSTTATAPSPPTRWTPYQNSCASHCWSIQSRPAAITVSVSWCGSPCSTISRPATSVIHESATSRPGLSTVSAMVSTQASAIGNAFAAAKPTSRPAVLGATGTGPVRG